MRSISSAGIMSVTRGRMLITSWLSRDSALYQIVQPTISVLDSSHTFGGVPHASGLMNIGDELASDIFRRSAARSPLFHRACLEPENGLQCSNSPERSSGGHIKAYDLSRISDIFRIFPAKALTSRVRCSTRYR